MELLKDKGQVVFYGPPGTGKTFFALRLAKALVAGDQQRIARVQFSSCYGLRGFLRGSAAARHRCGAGHVRTHGRPAGGHRG